MKLILQILRENKFYFIFFLLFLVAGTLLVLCSDKGDAILWANQLHSKTNDFIFLNWTKVGEETAFFAVMLLLLFIKIRYAFFVPIIGFIVTLVSFILKSLFGHPRPAAFFTDLGIFEDLKKVDLVHLIQASNSFPSGHTMAGFALFTYAALCVKSEWLKMISLILAVGVGFSRIYLIQHFLQDVCLGSLCGVIIAILVFKWQKSVKGKRWSKFDQPVYNLLVSKQLV